MESPYSRAVFFFREAQVIDNERYHRHVTGEDDTDPQYIADMKVLADAASDLRGMGMAELDEDSPICPPSKVPVDEEEVVMRGGQPEIGDAISVAGKTKVWNGHAWEWRN